MRTAAKPEKSLARTELTLAGLLLAAFIAAAIWVSPASAPTGSSTGLLPFTGSDVAFFLIAAGVALAIGAALVKRFSRG